MMEFHLGAGDRFSSEDVDLVAGPGQAAAHLPRHVLNPTAGLETLD